MKNWTKSYLCMVVPFSMQILPFYRQKPNLQERIKIGGANAPPNSLTKLQKRGFGCVSAARVWPSGHTLLVEFPGFAFWLYLQLDFSFKSGILTKWPFPWLQPIDSGRILLNRFSTSLILP